VTDRSCHGWGHAVSRDISHKSCETSVAEVASCSVGVVAAGRDLLAGESLELAAGLLDLVA